MIIFISDSLFLLYIITFLVIIITIYKCTALYNFYATSEVDEASLHKA